MQTHEVRAALAAKFCEPEYALLFEVGNGTGAYKSNSADAVAMSLYPSRGLELTMFEIKCHRGDWLKELKRPSKAEAIAKFCDYVYIVVGDKDIVKLDEMPTNWGLLMPTANNGVRMLKKAVKLDPLPMNRAMLAGLMRRRGETDRAQVKAEIAAEVKKITAKRIEDAVNYAVSGIRQERDRLNGIVERFREETGMPLDSWRIHQLIDAVKFVQAHGVVELLETLEHIKRHADRVSKQIADAEPDMAILWEKVSNDTTT